VNYEIKKKSAVFNETPCTTIMLMHSLPAAVTDVVIVGSCVSCW